MKFHTAILSLAILGTLNNNSHYVDAKIWSLRGLGRSTTTTTTNNNNDVIQGGSLINKQEEEEQSAAAVPTNHKNLGDYLFGEQRNLGKDKKKKGGGKKMKGEESVEVTVVETEEEGGKDGKKKKGEGKKTERTGDDIFIDAPEDVKRKHDACDADEEEVGAGTARRILKKKKGKKEDKKTMSDGVCDNCAYADDDEEGDEEAGLARAVEASDPSCDPDDVECTEEDDDAGLPGEEPSPDDEEEEGGDIEAIERRLMDPRRLTGNTAGIGQFTPLTCNPEVFDCSSAPGSLATLVANAAGGEVKVPCGQCYEVSVLLYLLIIVEGRGGEEWICYIYF